jgi:hypothetical protein
MKIWIYGLLAVAMVGCVAETESVAFSQNALHAWSTYHWASDNLTPSVFDKTRSSELTGETALSVAHWASLATPIQPQMSSRRQAPVTVVEGFSNDWLGLAQIWIEDGHIVKGKVSMNTTFLLGDPRFTFEATVHVLCQELGHIWGLGHNRDELDTCMNDCLTATTEAEWLACLNHPDGVDTNAHDVEQLLLAYDGHDDGTTGGSDPGPGGGPDCDERPTHPRCRNGTWVTVHTTPLWSPDLVVHEDDHEH